jgi:hypothetical protein
LRRGEGLRDNHAHAEMPNPANLLRLINEFILLLLGALLVLLALTRRLALPQRPGVWIVLGAFLIYWGVRAWMRPEPHSLRTHVSLRGGSLVLVGLLVLQVPLLPMRFEGLLLGVAGGILVVRGLLGGILFARAT